jgi:hypothetical protein
LLTSVFFLFSIFSLHQNVQMSGHSLDRVAIRLTDVESADGVLTMMQQQKRQTVWTKLSNHYRYAVLRLPDSGGHLLVAETAGTDHFNVQQLEGQLRAAFGDHFAALIFKPCHVPGGASSCTSAHCSRVHPRFKDLAELCQAVGAGNLPMCRLAAALVLQPSGRPAYGRRACAAESIRCGPASGARRALGRMKCSSTSPIFTRAGGTCARRWTSA